MDQPKLILTCPDRLPAKALQQIREEWRALCIGTKHAHSRWPKGATYVLNVKPYRRWNWWWGAWRAKVQYAGPNEDGIDDADLDDEEIEPVL